MTLTFITTLLVLQTRFVGSIPGGLGVPENITVTFLNPTSVKVSWATSFENVDKYDVTYKPTDASYRVVAVVAGNSGAVTLNGLLADTQYQLTVAAICAGRKYRSGPVVFRTLEPPRTSPQQDAGALGTGSPLYPPGLVPPTAEGETVQTFPTIRGVEVGIVVLVLIVWIGAIALFFNRWGKIRMLLPYQPDYKQEQLKVPGTGVLAPATTSCTGNHGGHACSQHFHWSTHQMASLDCEEHSPLTNPHRNRPRVNSAVFVSNDSAGFAGFDAGDFLRRYGSQSKLCKKARSADNIPLTTMEEDSTEKLHRDEDSSPTNATHHFGLPILSVSGPSPPDEDFEQIDEYL